VYLEGGYWCWDSPSCTERYQTDKFDMSSSGWKNDFAQTGIFGTDASTNPWAHANKIFVKVRARWRTCRAHSTAADAPLPPQYCSSDSWFGDAPASNATFGFAFRG
jgi:hypothetical protein